MQCTSIEDHSLDGLGLVPGFGRERKLVPAFPVERLTSLIHGNPVVFRQHFNHYQEHILGRFYCEFGNGQTKATIPKQSMYP